jgi:hypothetical protein
MNIYCTYITLYRGKKLPPFYIGSKDTHSVLNGYRGSVSSQEYGKIFKEELKNNPDLFSTKIISYHSTREEAFIKEQKIHLQLNVDTNPMYINKAIAFSRPRWRGVRGRKQSPQHIENRISKIRGISKIRIQSEKEKQKRREKMMGNTFGVGGKASRGKTWKLSENSKKKHSESLIGKPKSEEHKKALSLSAKKRWANKKQYYNKYTANSH